MLLDISIFTLTTLYLAISFFKQSRKSWAIAMILLIPTCAVSIFKIYGDQYDKEFAIKSLERIATRVNWDESELYLDLLTGLDDLNTGDFFVTLKILPNKLTHSGNDVVRSAFNQHCTKDKHTEFFYLSEAEAKKLYNTMLEPAGIYHDKEKAKGIEPFYYFGDSIQDSSLFDKKAHFRLELGPNSKSQFNSLSELNNTILVGSVASPTSTDLIPTWLYFKLETNSGSHLLHFPVKFETKDGILTNNSTRYVGMCFPENFFWSYQG